MAGVISELRSLAASVAALTEEVERLRTISAVRSAGTASVERRLGRLEDLLAAAHGGDARPDGVDDARHLVARNGGQWRQSSHGRVLLSSS